MRLPSPTVLVRSFALVSLATSTALLVDYWGYEVPFCAEAGCLAVRRYGYPAGLPMPLLGMLAFALLFAGTLAESSVSLRRLVLSFAVAGGGVAIGLLLYQPLVIKAWCLPCVITDVSAVLAGAAGGWGLWRERPLHALALSSPPAEPVRPPPMLADPIRIWGWLALGSLCVLAPLLWPRLRTDPAVPSGILAYYQAGKVNIVEFSDFQCGHCRTLHAQLRDLVAEFKHEVHFVRLNAPLASHPNARSAARMVVCAEAQGLADELADAFFFAESLEDSDQRTLARSRGLDLVALESCLRDPATEARIQKELGLLASTGLVVTPTTYVGTRRIPGAQPVQEFRTAIQKARKGESRFAIPALAFWGGTLGLAFAIVWFSRLRGAPPGPRNASV